MPSFTSFLQRIKMYIVALYQHLSEIHYPYTPYGESKARTMQHLDRARGLKSTIKHCEFCRKGIIVVIVDKEDWVKFDEK